MPKYHRRINIVDAVQYTCITDYFTIVSWYKKNNTSTLSAQEVFEYRHPLILINMRDGWAVAEIGDFIVMDLKGDIYPCKREVFLECYEPEVS